MKLGKALLFAILVLLLMLLLSFSLSFNARAQTSLPVININTGLGYATIQEAIDADATLNGHVIRVDAGTYYENVVVYKSVSLIGENRFSTVIDGRALGSVVNITASNVTVTGLTIRNSKYGYGGVHVYHSSGDNVSGNIVKDNYNGIYMYGCNDSIVWDNDVLGNEYGIHLYGSINVNISGNIASNNMNGIHLDVSSNDTVVDNNVTLSGGNGIYLYGSSNNTLLGNVLSSSPGRGIGFQYSFNNTIVSNVVSNNGYGIYSYGSGGNVLSDNTATFNSESGMLLFGSRDNTVTGNGISDNTFGIWFIDSDGNGISGNNVTSNSKYGVRLWNSSSNTFFHNNFMNNLVKNVEQPTNTSILNLWDNGAEGNSWGDYDGTDTNVNGIRDKPYIVDIRTWLGVYSQDNYPLMGEFFQFDTATENRSYTVTVVSNSTISSFQYHSDPDNKTNAVSFKVDGTNGTGFCLICIPHVLISPPFGVTVDEAPPLLYNVVRTNGTHTWIYLTYLQSEHELTVTSILPSEVPVWFLWWFWGITGLVVVDAALGAFAIRYRRKVTEQMNILQAYSPFVIAEALFKADIERRGLKIKEFEKKYSVKIQPRATLEDVIRSLETKEEEEKVS
jgi:parallel beta-helix repeat protein